MPSTEIVERSCPVCKSVQKMTKTMSDARERGSVVEIDIRLDCHSCGQTIAIWTATRPKRSGT